MPAARNLCLQPLRAGKPGDSIPLAEGKTTVGRDAGNDLCLPDNSVSRRHAEIVRAGEAVTISDLDSRNGVAVNGVPRKSATLHAGDEVEVGIFKFRVAESLAPARPAVKPALSQEPDLHATMPRPVQLPELKSDRHLSALYHVCYSLTEGFDEAVFLERCLPVLAQSLEAEQIQFFREDTEMAGIFPASKKKPPVKLAGYLVEQCQRQTEAAVISGESIRYKQKSVGGYNFLAGPIRLPGQAADQPCPVLVAIRPNDWAEFTPQDKVFMQAVCQLWARTLGRVREVQGIRQEIRDLKARASADGPQLLGRSAALENLRLKAMKAAKTVVSILLEGETGSGKEVVAHFIHQQSPRAAGPFVKMNCAAIPDGLIESELFGHHRGAFTDAKGERKGKFEQADGGTLFLDEIGEMPAGVQAKVLRALENGEIEKLGGEKVTRVDVRVVAATHRNLRDLSAAKVFREDLYYRLSVLTIKVPPLRDHLDDLEALASHFLDKFCEDNGLAALKFGREALAELKKHTWPGNVRELRNVVQRCAIEAAGTEITAGEVREVL